VTVRWRRDINHLPPNLLLAILKNWRALTGITFLLHIDTAVSLKPIRGKHLPTNAVRVAVYLDPIFAQQPGKQC
jgi:hypothetical protein